MEVKVIEESLEELSIPGTYSKDVKLVCHFVPVLKEQHSKLL